MAITFLTNEDREQLEKLIQNSNGNSLYVFVYKNLENVITVDRTNEEIWNAFLNNKAIYCVYSDWDTPGLVLQIVTGNEKYCMFRCEVEGIIITVEIANDQASVNFLDNSGGNVDLTGYVKSVNGNAPDENGNVKITIPDSGGNVDQSGLTSDIKSALMAVVEHIGVWADKNGQTYIDNLRTALYSAPIASITAVYNQSKTVYASDDLEVLRDDLTVTATYTDGSSSILSDYTLSGTLTVGTSIVTVSKDGKTATFEVEVTAARVPATGITLDKSTLSITSSAPVTLTATVTPDNATDTVVWASSEEAVAKVSSDGTVIPVADGSCVISATAGDFTAECTVNVALPLNGLNLGNPVLTYDSATMPHTSGLTEEEMQNKWYNSNFTAWGTALGINQYVLLHPFTNGTFYIRTVNRTLTPFLYFHAFSNADIGVNPTTTLGKVGDTYTDATVTKLTSFDWVDKDGNAKSGGVDLGEWEYVDGSGTTYTAAHVVLFKVTVPENVYVFMTASQMNASQFPGISENYPLNDLYTIFDKNPSANILQIVE